MNRWSARLLGMLVGLAAIAAIAALADESWRRPTGVVLALAGLIMGWFVVVSRREARAEREER